MSKHRLSRDDPAGKTPRAAGAEEMRTGTGASCLKKEEKRRKWHSLWGQICEPSESGGGVEASPAESRGTGHRRSDR